MRPSGLTCPPPSREPLDPPSSYERHVPRIARNTRRNTGLPQGIQPRNFPLGLIDAPRRTHDPEPVFTLERARWWRAHQVGDRCGFDRVFGGEGRELIILARRGGGLTMIASVRAKICETRR